MTIPDTHRDLLEGPIVVGLITMMPDGQPQATPIWCTYDGTHILFNTAVGRQKDRNLSADPRVTVLALDPENPYRYIEVRGEVAERTTENAEALIDELARLYTGSERFYGDAVPESERLPRVTYKIKPVRVLAR